MAAVFVSVGGAIEPSSLIFHNANNEGVFTQVSVLMRFGV